MAGTPPMTAIYGILFAILCVGLGLVPEPKLSAVCGILILIGWDVTLHLREVIALQQQQLQEHRVGTELTADKIEEYTALHRTLAEQTLVLHKELLAQHKEILAHSEEKLAQEKEKVPRYTNIVAMQKGRVGSNKERVDQQDNEAGFAQEEMLSQFKEMGTVHKELLGHCREMHGFQRRLVSTTDRSAVLQLRRGDMWMVQLLQMDVLLRKLGVEARPPLPPGGGLRPSRPGDHAQ